MRKLHQVQLLCSLRCLRGSVLSLQGHFQIMFSYQHCPLFQSKLSWPMRIMYSSGVWSYIVGAISTPTFILIPMITIWFGVFPIVVSQWTALGVTVYYFATNLVRQPSLLRLDAVCMSPLSLIATTLPDCLWCALVHPWPAKICSCLSE